MTNVAHIVFLLARAGVADQVFNIQVETKANVRGFIWVIT